MPTPHGFPAKARQAVPTIRGNHDRLLAGRHTNRWREGRLLGWGGEEKVLVAKRRRKRKNRSKRTALTVAAVASLTAVGLWALWRVSQPEPAKEFRFPTPSGERAGLTPEIQAVERARLESILEAGGVRGDPPSR